MSTLPPLMACRGIIVPVQGRNALLLKNFSVDAKTDAVSHVCDFIAWKKCNVIEG